MPRNATFLVRFSHRRGLGRAGHPPVRPRGFLHRSLQKYWIFVALPTTVLLGAGIYLWSPWNHQPCAAGMDAVGSPYVCVGLDLNSAALRTNDPLALLERSIARYNARVTGNFKTIVILTDLTPDPNTDSASMKAVSDGIEGAITAAWPENQPDGIKLLLANFASNAAYWRQAVNSIIRYTASQHIMAVTGLGESLDNTRHAVAALSRRHIVTIGSVVTADNMNRDTDNLPSDNFFRVGPTNTDEVSAAVRYINARRPTFKRIMLIKETNPSDSYAKTLASAFEKQLGRRQIEFTLSYQSPGTELTGTTRDDYLELAFDGMHADICTDQPDLIYFAGRGRDIGDLVTSLANVGACPETSVTIMTGDDVSDIIGSPVPLLGAIHADILYTALAYPGEWDNALVDSDYRTNYNDFADKFTRLHHFRAADLLSGDAMMDHDAVVAAVNAAKADKATNPASMWNLLSHHDCHSALPGASGFIAFQPGTGNQIDKAMPILQITATGSVRNVGLVWSQGHPLDMSKSCSSEAT